PAPGSHVLALKASGSNPVTLSLTIDGVEAIHAVDSGSSALAAGLAGIFDYNGAAQPIDDFTVGGNGSGSGGSDGGVGDGGSDGGASDAGTSDGGASDAGADGGVTLAADDFTSNGPLGQPWTVWRGAFTVSGGAAYSAASRSYATLGSAAADVTVSAIVEPRS